MDVIRLHSAGIENAVSSLGTTLSEIQLRKLWEFSDVTFLFVLMEIKPDRGCKKIAIKVLNTLNQENH